MKANDFVIMYNINKQFARCRCMSVCEFIVAIKLENISDCK